MEMRYLEFRMSEQSSIRVGRATCRVAGETLAETFSKQDEMPAYDERTGEELPPEKVQAGRGRELDKMTEHNVKVDITWQRARGLGLKIVNSRWADGWKHLPNDPKGVRSR